MIHKAAGLPAAERLSTEERKAYFETQEKKQEVKKEEKPLERKEEEVFTYAKSTFFPLYKGEYFL